MTTTKKTVALAKRRPTEIGTAPVLFATVFGLVTQAGGSTTLGIILGVVIAFVPAAITTIVNQTGFGT